LTQFLFGLQAKRSFQHAVTVAFGQRHDVIGEPGIYEAVAGIIELVADFIRHGRAKFEGPDQLVQVFYFARARIAKDVESPALCLNRSSGWRNDSSGLITGSMC
jgi:hypothetical protein